MQMSEWVNTKKRQIKTHFRVVVLSNLFISLSLQMIFLLGNIFHESYAQAVDEKPIPHEKNNPSSPGTHITSLNSDDLELISGYAEDIFDLAKAGKWKRASKKLAHLEKIEQRLTDNGYIIGVDKLTALTKATLDLEQAIAVKSRQVAMITSNKITAIVALITKPLKQRVPTNVLLLYYFDRELEIWSETKNTNKLSEIVTKMHLTWQALMPLFIAKGDSKDVKKFGDIMKRLEAAKTPEEYGNLTNSVHDEVDNLEKVFLQRP